MVNSKAGEAYLVRAGGVPREKIVLIRNWFKMDPALQKQLAYDSRPASVQTETVGYAGRLSKVKRLDLLIRAFAGVIMSRPDANLVLLGSGPERHDLENLVEALDLKEKVSFQEPVIDVMRVMRSFSCLVLPSAFEGLPNVAIEALALGIPIVSSAVGDMAEIVSNGKTGFLLKEVTPEALADRILKALTDTSLAENARLEGPKLVAERFTMQAALEKLIPMYEDLLKANRREGFTMGSRPHSR
jgi:glycosyltransferase involved in cell wall biosynthesis